MRFSTRMKRFGAFCSSMPADCSRNTNGAALPSMIGTSDAVRSTNALSMPRPAIADIRCSTVPTLAESALERRAERGLDHAQRVGRHVDGLRQVEAPKHDAGIGRRRAKSHVDLLARVQADAGGANRFLESALSHASRRSVTSLLLRRLGAARSLRLATRRLVGAGPWNGRRTYHSAVRGGKERGARRPRHPLVRLPPQESRNIEQILEAVVAGHAVTHCALARDGRLLELRVVRLAALRRRRVPCAARPSSAARPRPTA